MVTRLTITKIEVARRQLEIAALLYFNERDPLAIHTLAAAAQGVLETLTERAGKTTVLHDSLFTQLPEDLARQVRQAIRGPQNFLKHADRDPDGSLEYAPEMTELILYDAVVAYMRLTGDRPPYLGAFVIWIGMSQPTWFEAAGPDIQTTMKKARQLIAPEGRQSFISNYLSRVGILQS